MKFSASGDVKGWSSMHKRIGFAAGALAACIMGLWPVAAHAQYDCVTNSGKITLTRYTGPGGAVVIPDATNGLPVTGLGSFLFSGNGTLTNVVIPSSVKSIGNYAFNGCSNLASAVIGTHVSVIGKHAFRYCANLTTLKLGKRVARIGDYAFGNCSKLDEVVFPSKLTHIGTAAFINCTSLGEVVLSNRIYRVGDFAFYGCSNLTGVTIGTNIRTIGIGAFNYCRNLVRVSIGSGLAKVGRDAFHICPNLTGIYFYGDFPSFGSGLHSTYAAKKLKLYHYKGTTGWPKTVQGHKTAKFTRMPTLSVKPSVRSVGHLAGQVTFAVTNRGNGKLIYVASEADSWLSIVSGGHGTNQGTLRVAYSNNTTPAVRTGLVTVVSLEATNSPRIVKIVQPAKPLLLVDPWQRSVDHQAGTTTFTIANQYPGNSMTYTVSETSSWINIVSGANGTNAGTVTLTYAANASVSARTGTVTVTAPGATSSPKVRKIIQAGLPILTVTPGFQSVGYKAGHTNFDIANTGGGSMRYTATVANVSTSWMRITSGTPGANHGTVVLYFDENPGAAARTGTFTVAAAAGIVHSPSNVRVVQAGRPQLTVTPTTTNVSLTVGTAAFTVANLGGAGMVYTSSITAGGAFGAISNAAGTDSGTIYVDYNFSIPGQRIDVTVTAPDSIVPNVVVSIVLTARRRASAAKSSEPVASSISAAGAPVAVVTSDDVAPDYESGWAAVDGDPETAWTGQKPGGGYMAVEYRPALELKALEVDLAEDSLAGLETLYSVDGTAWQPLPEDMDAHPVSLNFLWLVFPDDGTDAVPGVLEITPNP
jgi:hypothetical protein